MKVTIEGVLKRCDEVKGKDGRAIEVGGKPLYTMLIEQPSEGPTERAYVTTIKNSRKINEQVKIVANVYLKVTERGRFLKVMEVNK
jgi:hypothetical protein